MSAGGFRIQRGFNMLRSAARTALGAVATSVAAIACVQTATAQSAAPDPALAPDGAAAGAAESAQPVQTIEIVAKVQRLNEARTEIQTKTGASVYTLDSAAINVVPGGDNTLL